MATLTLGAIYSLSPALSAALAPALEWLPPLVRSFVISGLLVILMTYVVMPRVTRLFARWLYPARDARWSSD
jgi:antibiotic biosynthesis monooxygenase (ABM) superfamily enzyme